MTHSLVAGGALAAFGEAWDCHVHVFGNVERYPMSPQRRYTPPPRGHVELERHLEGIGAGRVVLVQASIYGSDNRCLLDALDGLNNRARAVIAPAPGLSESDLGDLHRRGVRGVRFNPVSDAAALAAAVASLADSAAWIRRAGWHVELNATPATAILAGKAMDELALPMVFDHVFGLRPDNADFDRLLPDIFSLMANPRVWVKISGMDRLPPQADNVRMVDVCTGLMRIAPDRVVWGSDWPHTPTQDLHAGPVLRNVADAEIAAAAADLAGPGGQALFVDNPSKLYDSR